MNALTTRHSMPSAGSSSALAIELGKMLALVAPSSMTADQQELWLMAAVDSLEGIRSEEVAYVSAEVRRSVTRHNQIVPEITKLVSERRSKEQKNREFSQANLLPAPVKKDVMDRRGEPMSEVDTAHLNDRLERLGATARYRTDGSRYMINAQ